MKAHSTPSAATEAATSWLSAEIWLKSLRNYESAPLKVVPLLLCMILDSLLRDINRLEVARNAAGA